MKKLICLSFVLCFMSTFIIRTNAAYFPPESYRNPSVVVHIGSKEYLTDDGANTEIFQKAINDVHMQGGGFIIVPEGNYHIMELQMKSDVHFQFLEGAVIYPDMEVLRWEPSEKAKEEKIASVEQEYKAGNVFNFGRDNYIKNVSIVGAEGGTVFDFRSVNTGMRAVFIGSCDQFQIRNLIFQDNFTPFSSLTFAWGGYRNKTNHPTMGLPRDEIVEHNPGFPSNALIENITAVNAHYGYGSVQAHSGSNMHFHNIQSTGGIAVRLESGLTAMNLSRLGGLFNITIDGLISRNGQAALFFQPHTMKHGDVWARNIEAYGSEFGVAIDPAFVSAKKYKDNPMGLTPGSFTSITVENVKVVYDDGPTTTRGNRLPYYPKELHHLIWRAGLHNEQYRGPSIAAIVNMNPEGQSITIKNLEAVGFKYHKDMITPDDRYKGDISHIRDQPVRGKQH